jgi:hypothetical protein
MDAKSEFVTRALADAEAESRYLDLKAGLMVITETILLVIAIASLASNPLFNLVAVLTEGGATWYAAVLVALFILVAVALIGHILLTLRVLLPIPRPERHVDLGGFSPSGLYFLGDLDAGRRIVPSVAEYGRQLAEMSDETLSHEYIFELQKRSFVRQVKNDRLALAFSFLGVVIIGLALYGFLIALAGLLF